MVDRKEETGGHIVGRGDTPKEAAPRPALGYQQRGPGKAFGLQLLLDPLRKASIEDELGNVTGTDRAFGFRGMSHIENDPEFRRIACWFQRGEVQGDRPQGGKLYSVGFRRCRVS